MAGILIIFVTGLKARIIHMKNEKEIEEKEQEIIEGQTAETEGQMPVSEKDRKKKKLAQQAGRIKELSASLDQVRDELKQAQTELEQTKEELEKSRQAAGEAKDMYLRLQAEWDNYRRRTAKERLELIDNAGRDILTGFLPVLDDCQRALNVLSESDAAQAAVEGTELIYNKLIAYLKQRGVERIEARGAVFDTDFHEAVAQFPVEDPEKKNTVIDVTQEGYTLNGNVIRYAKVVVGI